MSSTSKVTKKTLPEVTIYDTTLRDGSQMANINFSRQDKYTIVQNLLDELGIQFIEVYPYSNPKDRELIQIIKEKENNSKYLQRLSAFGSTRRVDKSADEDENLEAIINSGLTHATIFGKSWDFHLQFIKASAEENLKMIEESVGFLKAHKFTVFFDAEHFFDGYLNNSDYALQTLRAAERGGADALILCDTNGGTLPHDIYDITEIVLNQTKIPLGIHAHHDCGMANANSIAAVQACIKYNRPCQIQGCMNGLGERAGNANLTTIIPNIVLKMKIPAIKLENLRNLTSVSNLIYELANMVPPTDDPFVGYNAFAHKGGMHIAAVEKDFRSYENIDPELVGNKRRVLVSEMSGKSALLHKFQKFGISIGKDDPLVSEILAILKRKESHGYTYEGADASLEILIRGMMQDMKLAATYYRRYFFEVDYFRVITDVRSVFHEEDLRIITDANIKTKIAEGEENEFHTAADGNGPVNALDRALKKSLVHFYPVLSEIELVDFKVRIANAVESEQGTASRVRVFIETKDKDGQLWGTIGAHVNIIVASFVALIDSYVYKLLKSKTTPAKENQKAPTPKKKDKIINEFEK